MSFICIIIKNHFHINSFVLSLALKVRFFGTRKWPIGAIILQNYKSFEPRSHFTSRGDMIFQVSVVLKRTVAMLLVVSPTSFANVPARVARSMVSANQR